MSSVASQELVGLELDKLELNELQQMQAGAVAHTTAIHCVDRGFVGDCFWATPLCTNRGFPYGEQEAISGMVIV